MKRIPVDSAALHARADWLQDRLDALPARYVMGEGRDAFDARTRAHAAAVDLLRADILALPEAPRRYDDHSGARLTMLDIRCTSTEGVIGACHNWIARVRAAN